MSREKIFFRENEFHEKSNGNGSRRWWYNKNVLLSSSVNLTYLLLVMNDIFFDAEKFEIEREYQ